MRLGVALERAGDIAHLVAALAADDGRLLAVRDGLHHPADVDHRPNQRQVQNPQRRSDQQQHQHRAGDHRGAGQPSGRGGGTAAFGEQPHLDPGDLLRLRTDAVHEGLAGAGQLDLAGLVEPGRILQNRLGSIGNGLLPFLNQPVEFVEPALLGRVIRRQSPDIGERLVIGCLAGPQRFEKARLGRQQIAPHAGFAIDHGGDERVDAHENLIGMLRHRRSRFELAGDDPRHTADQNARKKQESEGGGHLP